MASSNAPAWRPNADQVGDVSDLPLRYRYLITMDQLP